MKVRVCYTSNVSDDYRRALAHRVGEHGTKAARDEIRRHLEDVGSSYDDDLMQEWQDCTEGCQPEAPR